MTLMEVLLATAILAMALFAILSLASLGLRSGQKSFDQTVAIQVADQQLNQVIVEALTGYSNDLFDQDYLYPTNALKTGTTTVGREDFSWAIYAQTVYRTDSTALGEGSQNNAVKKVDVVVRWWGEQGQGHQGYGRLQCSISRLVGQGDTP